MTQAASEPVSAKSEQRAQNNNVGDNNPLTVSELSRELKEHVEDRFSNLSVRGELSGVKVSRLGHLYFTLKDEKAALDAICWSGRAQRLGCKPEEGLEVIAHGALSTYPSRSRYQMVVEALEPAGMGALLQQLERRKKKLATEGLFATERKRKLPLLPRRIAVFTSEQGAVWQDIRQRLGQRCPVNIALFPVAVQGREAEGSLLQAFALLQEALASEELGDLDVVIVARGGGSIEDLWVFNEESIVRAAVACPLPVVSAIGHESDGCLLDLAADLRAATPTAAVELVVPQRSVLRDNLLACGERTRRVVERCLEEVQTNLRTASLALPRALQMRAVQARERLQRCALTLRHAFSSFAQELRARLARQRLSARWLVDALARARARLVELETSRRRALAARVALSQERLLRNRRLLESLSFQRVLERGYAIVRDGKRVVRSACELPEGVSFDTLFADRSILAARAGKVVRPPSRQGIAAGERAKSEEAVSHASHARRQTSSPPSSIPSSPPSFVPSSIPCSTPSTTASSELASATPFATPSATPLRQERLKL